MQCSYSESTTESEGPWLTFKYHFLVGDFWKISPEQSHPAAVYTEEDRVTRETMAFTHTHIHVHTHTHTHNPPKHPPQGCGCNEGVRYPSGGPGSHRKWSSQIRLSAGQMMRGVSGKRRHEPDLHWRRRLWMKSYKDSENLTGENWLLFFHSLFCAQSKMYKSLFARLRLGCLTSGHVYATVSLTGNI